MTLICLTLVLSKIYILTPWSVVWLPNKVCPRRSLTARSIDLTAHVTNKCSKNHALFWAVLIRGQRTWIDHARSTGRGSRLERWLCFNEILVIFKRYVEISNMYALNMLAFYVVWWFIFCVKQSDLQSNAFYISFIFKFKKKSFLELAFILEFMKQTWKTLLATATSWSNFLPGDNFVCRGGQLSCKCYTLEFSHQAFGSYSCNPDTLP